MYLRTSKLFNIIVMQKIFLIAFTFFSVQSFSQKVDFEEYTLPNGLHVILYQDNSVPVVKVEVMYGVGSKDDPKNKTGFAHFFEHLLFEGTQNIERGEWFKIVSANGGRNNAYTTYDLTTYFEIFPSNQLELGLWMESERLLHPVINEIGVQTQNGVIKEERRQTQDNRPYGNLISEVTRHLFPQTGYQHAIIGSMEDLDNATLQDFIQFHKDFYKPNNAVLVVAGDFKKTQAKKWIEEYFGPIPKGAEVERNPFRPQEITSPIEASFTDPNIQTPMMVLAYRTPPADSREALVLDLISSVLSDGKSSRLSKKLVDDKKMALFIGAFNYALKHSGMYLIFGLPLGDATMEDLVREVDEEIERLQSELISEREYQKLMNQYENNFVQSNSSPEGIATTLATNFTMFRDASRINTELDMYRSITREEIQEVARKYLQPTTRLFLRYVPEEEATAVVVDETIDDTSNDEVFSRVETKKERKRRLKAERKAAKRAAKAAKK
jgi:predicted Zn-dependent peptidase